MQPLDPFTMPLAGRRLIEASAGTGKTWTLTLLILRMILEEGLAIEQILVLTYTRAACAELRSRLRSRLREAQLQLQGQATAEDAALARVLAAIPPETAALRLQRTQACMDEAVIATIHGFCQKILQEHAVEAGLAFDREIVSDEGLLREQIVADFWRIHFYPLGPEESALVAATWQGPAALLAAIAPTLMIDDDCLWPQLPAGALHDQCNRVLQAHADLRQAWAEGRQELEECLHADPCLSRSEKNYRQDQVQALLSDLETLLTQPIFPCLLPQRLERLAAGVMAQRVLKKKACAAWQPPCFCTSFESFWQQYRQMLRLWKITRLFEARAFLQAGLHARKKQNRLLGYDDLLTQLDAALRAPESGERLLRAIRSRYRAVLVDEFQDTDPVQYRIFSAIGAEDGYPFHMIGDPKQAIYSFRGGDIFTYMRAKQETPADQRFTMTTNHRSAPGMVAVVNTLFARQPQAFVFAEAIPFHPVAAGGRVRDGEFVLRGSVPAPLQALLFGQEEGKALARGSADPQAATRAAAAIRELLLLAEQGAASIGARRLDSGDVAVLVHSHNQAELMRSALRRLGLNSVYASRISVFTSGEAEELERLLHALLNPTDRAAGGAALATSLFGLDAGALYRLQDDASLWAEWMQRLRGYQEHWRQHGINAMLYRLFRRERIGSRLSTQPDGERRLTNLLHLCDLLHEEEGRAPGMERLLRWLQRQGEESDSEERRLMRLESDQALIRISTLHSAKGLEYPIVFLPFLWRSREDNKNEVIAFHDRATLCACRDFDSDNEAHLALAREEAVAEEMRLLYVALTRARHCTCICWGRVSGMMATPMARLLHPQDVSGDEGLLRGDLTRLNSTGTAALVHVSLPDELPWRADAVSAAAVPAPVPVLAASRLQRPLPQGCITCSYTSLSATQEQNPVLEEGADHMVEPQPVFQFPAEEFHSVAAFPRGTRAGLCLHALLEALDFLRPVDEQRDLLRQRLEQYGFDPRWLPLLVQWLTQVLTTPLPGSRSLAGLEAGEQLRELGFLFPVQRLAIGEINHLLSRFTLPPLAGCGEVARGLMKGFVDLVFRHQGRYFIVDYKSNHLGTGPDSYNDQALAASMAQHHYHLQYLLYTLALHRHLRARMPHYDYERHFGGVYYLFLRGMEPGQAARGICRARPKFELIAGLDRLCRGKETEHAAA